MSDMELTIAIQQLSDADADPESRDLTPRPGHALDEQAFALSHDGATVVTGWAVDDEPGFPRPQLVAIRVATLVVVGGAAVYALNLERSLNPPHLTASGRILGVSLRGVPIVIPVLNAGLSHNTLETFPSVPTTKPPE